MRIAMTLLFVAVLFVSMSAATIRVPQDQLTIQAGINAANAAVALDPSRVTVMEPPAGAPTWATDWNDWLVWEREKDID